MYSISTVNPSANSVTLTPNNEASHKTDAPNNEGNEKNTITRPNPSTKPKQTYHTDDIGGSNRLPRTSELFSESETLQNIQSLTENHDEISIPGQKEKIASLKASFNEKALQILAADDQVLSQGAEKIAVKMSQMESEIFNEGS